MYEDSTTHPMQKKARWRMNRLIGLIDENPGIQRDRLYSLCYVNYGWYKKTLKNQIDMLIEFGKLTEENGKLFTYTHSLSPVQKQTELSID